MQFDKPKVTIDLEEYSELIKLKEYSNSVVEGISQAELSKAITYMLKSVAHGNGLDDGVRKAYSELGIVIQSTQDHLDYTDFKFLKSIK